MRVYVFHFLILCEGLFFYRLYLFSDLIFS